MKVINCDHTTKEVTVQELVDLLNRIDRCLYLVQVAQDNLAILQDELDEMEHAAKVDQGMKPWEDFQEEMRKLDLPAYAKGGEPF